LENTFIRGFLYGLLINVILWISIFGWLKILNMFLQILSEQSSNI